MIPAVITDHADRAKGRLIEQFKNATLVNAIIKAFSKQYQWLEDQIWIGLNSRSIAAASYALLDKYGKIVNEPRNGRAQEDYRIAVALRILVNRSKGRANDIIQIAYLAFSPVVPVYEEFVAAFSVAAYQVATGWGTYAKLFGQARAAGSRGVLLITARPASETFRFSWSGGTTGTVFEWSGGGGTGPNKLVHARLMDPRA